MLKCLYGVRVDRPIIDMLGDRGRKCEERNTSREKDYVLDGSTPSMSSSTSYI